ncbi:amidase [Burkholderia sp. Ax-1724]|nr:amidase [Burkholderia sp. Ax-1724]
MRWPAKEGDGVGGWNPAEAAPPLRHAVRVPMPANHAVSPRCLVAARTARGTSRHFQASQARRLVDCHGISMQCGPIRRPGAAPAVPAVHSQTPTEGLPPMQSPLIAYTPPSSYVSHAAAFRSGATSPLALLETGLARLDAREHEVRAFVALALERARAEAQRSTQRWLDGKPLSPLDGIAIGVKDIIETADLPTAQGSPMWTGTQTRRDAASVQALRQAGAIIVGKTSTAEFAATEMFSSTANPHDPQRTPGGSSAGSAAAVGAGFVPLALGSQVVGSTIRPASYCGCIGFKPTYGALNRSGSFDHLSHSAAGLLGTTLDDVWAAARAIASRVGGDPGHAGLMGPDSLPDARAAPPRAARNRGLERGDARRACGARCRGGLAARTRRGSRHPRAGRGGRTIRTGAGRRPAGTDAVDHRVGIALAARRLRSDQRERD